VFLLEEAYFKALHPNEGFLTYEGTLSPSTLISLSSLLSSNRTAFKYSYVCLSSLKDCLRNTPSQDKASLPRPMNGSIEPHVEIAQPMPIGILRPEPH
jgi:hypothetical protein